MHYRICIILGWIVESMHINAAKIQVLILCCMKVNDLNIAIYGHPC